MKKNNIFRFLPIFVSGGFLLFSTSCYDARSRALSNVESGSLKTEVDRGSADVYLAPGFELFSEDLDYGFDALLDASKIFEYATSNSQTNLIRQRRYALDATGAGNFLTQPSESNRSGTEGEEEDAEEKGPFEDEKVFPDSEINFPAVDNPFAAPKPAYHEALEYSYSVLQLGQMLKNRYSFGVREKILDGLDRDDLALVVIPGEFSVRPGRKTRLNYQVLSKVEFTNSNKEQENVRIIAVSPAGLSNFMLESTKVLRSLSADVLLAALGGNEGGSAKVKALIDSYNELQESIAASEFRINVTESNTFEILYSSRRFGNSKTRLASRNYKFEVFALVSKVQPVPAFLSGKTAEGTQVRGTFVGEFVRDNTFKATMTLMPVAEANGKGEKLSEPDLPEYDGIFYDKTFKYCVERKWLPTKGVWSLSSIGSGYKNSVGDQDLLVHFKSKSVSDSPVVTDYGDLVGNSNLIEITGRNLTKLNFELWKDGKELQRVSGSEDETDQSSSVLSYQIVEGKKKVVFIGPELKPGERLVVVGRKKDNAEIALAHEYRKPTSSKASLWLPVSILDVVATRVGDQVDVTAVVSSPKKVLTQENVVMSAGPKPVSSFAVQGSELGSGIYVLTGIVEDFPLRVSAEEGELKAEGETQIAILLYRRIGQKPASFLGMETVRIR